MEWKYQTISRKTLNEEAKHRQDNYRDFGYAEKPTLKIIKENILAHDDLEKIEEMYNA